MGSVLDVAGAAVAAALVAALLFALLDPTMNQRAARLWAQRLASGDEAACPTMFGKAFWFACAAEAKRRDDDPPLSAGRT